MSEQLVVQADNEVRPELNNPAAMQVKVAGEPFTQLPEDLFIPPEALQVFLETFEGPLDLLLYLIRKQNLDILAINVAEVTRQYTSYLDLMQELQLELAAEYLVMAALLAEIKSRSLLPRNQELLEDDEDDPRAELIRRLLEYERFKNAAERLDALPRQERDLFAVQPQLPSWQQEFPFPEVDLDELLFAFARLMQRHELVAKHHISREPLSTRERMARILGQLQGEEGYVGFESFFDFSEGKAGMVVTFMALLELIKEQLIELVQAQTFARIYLRLKVEV